MQFDDEAEASRRALIRRPSPLMDDPSFWPHFRPMPEEAGSHVVDLGGGRLLMATSAPRSARLIAELGYTPVLVDITEFEKMEGCVTCLSVRLRHVPLMG
jgi:dimethylargininase